MKPIKWKIRLLNMNKSVLCCIAVWKIKYTLTAFMTIKSNCTSNYSISGWEPNLYMMSVISFILLKDNVFGHVYVYMLHPPRMTVFLDLLCAQTAIAWIIASSSFLLPFTFLQLLPFFQGIVSCSLSVHSPAEALALVCCHVMGKNPLANSHTEHKWHREAGVN